MTKHLLKTQADHKVDGDMLVSRFSQDITDEMMEEIDLLRKLQAAKGRIGEWHHVARVPRVIHEKWLREGFDPRAASEEDVDAHIEQLRELMARLRKANLDKFIVTNKTF